MTNPDPLRLIGELQDRNAKLKARIETLEAALRAADKWLPTETKPPFVTCEERGIYTDNGDGLFFFKATHWRKPDETCPVCGGDCSAANPPVYNCPMEKDPNR